jgi:hypothetical protein
MDKENTYTIMVINIKVYGSMIKNRVMEFYRWKLVTRIQDSGKIVKNMEEVYISLAIKITMRGSLYKE